jgi:putative CocE/NonD family hydrolase
MRERVVVDQTRAAMRDGVELAAEVTRVADAGPQPVLLLRCPYNRNAIRNTLDVVSAARLGWAVVAQTVRGCGESGGEFQAFVNERADGEDTVAWCARQPWCDGRVAMFGGSYLGFVQWQAAASGTPALRAIAPTYVGDSVRDIWLEGNAFGIGFATFWGAAMTVRPGSPADDVAALFTDWTENAARPPARHPLRALSPTFDRWLDDDGDYWRPLDLSGQHAHMDVAGLHTAGWYDFACEGGIRNWRAMATAAGTERARAAQRLIIGPWSHGTLYGQSYPELDFGPAANGVSAGLVEESLRWLRAALDGEAVATGVRAFVMGRNDWVDLDDWPPPATTTDLYLAAETDARSLRGDGQLIGRPKPTGGVDRVRHDPDRPVPTRGGRIVGPWLPPAGPCDQRPVEDRDDVLVYTSAPVTEDVTVMGPVVADITLASTARSADLAVTLVDVHPDGRAFNVVDSIGRTAGPAGEARRVRVELGSTAQTFRRGHRIRVDIASSNFPRFDVNPSTGARLAEVDRLESAVHSVFHGAAAPSQVRLPVVEGGLPRDPAF